MESGFGVGRYRGDVVANLGAGFASFCRRPRRRSAPKLVLANNEPVSFRGVFASACLFKRRFAPQETSAARHGGFERQAVCKQLDGRF